MAQFKSKHAVLLTRSVSMQCNVRNAMQYNAMQCNTMQCNAMQCNAWDGSPSVREWNEVSQSFFNFVHFLTLENMTKRLVTWLNFDSSLNVRTDGRLNEAEVILPLATKWK
jgi:hypothetical protein